ncbi:MAG: polyprenyl synthetase family protein [Lachnospiraceae bacterium]
MKFDDNLKEKVEAVEVILDRYLPEENDYQKVIMEAMAYSVKAGGKRIRPLLMQTTYEMFGGTGKLAQPFMAAMEMLHTYSLVHDDLPAMDNDDYRRGRLTTHKVYGEAIGVLCGDALLNYAYETAATAFDQADSREDYVKISEALRVFMGKAGIYGMIGGQTVDVLNDGKPLTQDMLDFIFRLKTGALLEASVMIGAILAGACDEDVKRMEQVGRGVGMAFQIQDDILDVIGDEKVLGKPVLSDEKNNKTTYVTLYGMDKAKADVIFYTKMALDALCELKDAQKVKNTEFFEQVVQMLVNREK